MRSVWRRAAATRVVTPYALSALGVAIATWLELLIVRSPASQLSLTPFGLAIATSVWLGGLGPGNLYFDPTVYSQPAAASQGNMKRHTGPDGPGFWEIDASLFKRFPLGGSRTGEFRVDTYNTTNSVRWANPGTGYSTGTGNTFGQITNPTGSQRTVRFGARFTF